MSKKSSTTKIPAFFTKLCNEMQCAVAASAVSKEGSRLVSTGDPLLDWSTGGGIVKNRINVFTGRSGSGKSFLCAKVAAKIQQESGNNSWIIWLDTEYLLHNQPERLEYFERIGIDISRLFLISSNQSDVIFSKLNELEIAIKNQEITVCTLVIDSFGGLEDKHAAEKFAEGEIEDTANKFGGNARLIGALVKKIVRMSAENNMTTLIVQHVIIEQGNTMSRSPKYIVTGGEKLRLISDLFLLSETVERKDALITSDNESVEFSDKGFVAAGKTIRFKCLKTRHSVEGRTVEVKINFEAGEFVRVEDSLLSLAKLLGVIVHPVNQDTGKENALWWTLKSDNSLKWQGEKQVLQALKDKKIYDKVYKECLSIYTKPTTYNPETITIEVEE